MKKTAFILGISAVVATVAFKVMELQAAEPSYSALTVQIIRKDGVLIDIIASVKIEKDGQVFVESRCLSKEQIEAYIADPSTLTAALETVAAIGKKIIETQILAPPILTTEKVDVSGITIDSDKVKIIADAKP